MTKEHYMALADLKTVWDDSLKPYIQQTFATKQEAVADFATVAECQAAAAEIAFTPTNSN